MSGSVGATARAVCRPSVSSHTDACIHVFVGGRWDSFSTLEKRCWGCAGWRAQPARELESDGATARAVCRPSVSSHTDALHTCWRGQSTRPIFDHRETVMGAVPAGAHSLRESRGAMAVRRRQCLLIACRCLTTTMWPTRNQQTPYQCAHRMQISSTYRHESLKSHAKTARCLSKAS